MAPVSELHEIGTTVARVDQRLLDLTDRFDKYLVQHSNEHGRVEERWTLHLKESASVAHIAKDLEDHEARLRQVEDSLLQLKTMGNMIKIVLGASVIGAAIGLINLIDLIAHSAGS